MPSAEDRMSSHSIPANVEEASDQFDQVKQALRGRNGPPSRETLADASFAPLVRKVASYWWVLALVGVLWVVVAVVVLKFNQASVTTVGIFTGLMFLFFAAEDFVLAALGRGAGWLWAIFGVLLTAGGIVALIHPRNTFVGFADILGFVFLLIAVKWIVQAFAERAVNELWWLSLISGILMLGLAFWVSGEFFLTKAATLLVFAGIWALMTGVLYIVRAFQLRELGRTLG